jgi:hypothetical protein
MRIIQLTSQETGDHLGLYRTERTDDNVGREIEETFAEAIAEAENNDDLDPHEIADDYLEMRGIIRIFADEIFIPNL